MTQIRLDALFNINDTSRQVRLNKAHRVESTPAGLNVTLDSFSEDVACAFMRLGTDPAHAEFQLRGHYTLQKPAAGGWLLLATDTDLPHYWLPREPIARTLDAQGHILTESAAELGDLRFGSDALSIDLTAPAAHCLNAVIWRLAGAARAVADEIAALTHLETQRYFLLGSHTAYAKPADVYRHLIHGQVYEDRYAWPHRRKICSENDAHALYLVLSGLERATGKRLYGLLKKQLVLSVLSRQGSDGGFHHGEWTDDMEAHFRLNASAMHLLMDAHDEAPDPAIRQSLDRAAAFLARQRERIQFGVWFLHDELELSEAGMAAAPFRWIASRALGKSPANMLVLNSHLDTSVGLARYNQLARDQSLEQVLASARASTLGMLRQRPAEWLYRILMAAIRPTLLPSAEAAALPLHRRIIKRLAWQYLIPRLPRIKARFPRLVMPGGYIDRELTLQTWAHHYLGINLMDMARHQRRFPIPEITAQIRETVRFGHESGILRRWAELKYEKYALGFWAEALYHCCLLDNDHELRQRLAEAMLLLEDTGQGQPPSLLGANAEAVPVAQQAPCPSPVDARLRIANLSSGNQLEFLVVNPTGDPIVLAWQDHGAMNLAWHDGQERPATSSVPPRAWLHGTATEAGR